jgi:hypothetical protein
MGTPGDPRQRRKAAKPAIVVLEMWMQKDEPVAGGRSVGVQPRVGEAGEINVLGVVELGRREGR